MSTAVTLAKTIRRGAVRERASLHAITVDAEATDYAKLPPSDPRVLAAILDQVQARLTNVEYAAAHYQQLLATLRGERAYLLRRLGVKEAQS